MLPANMVFVRSDNFASGHCATCPYSQERFSEQADHEIAGEGFASPTADVAEFRPESEVRLRGISASIVDCR